MREHERILDLAAQGKLPNTIDDTSDPSAPVVQELVEAGYLNAIDASSNDGRAYLNPRITMGGREYLDDLRQRRADKEVRIAKTSTVASNNEHQLPRTTEVWQEIERTYDVPKKTFGKRIAFVSDHFKRKVIFRDLEQAFVLAEYGFNKPAVILAGSVIEELLRLYLAHKEVKSDNNTLDSYIKTCEKNNLLKGAIHTLADAIRQFRNIVHLSGESSSKHTISKATAKGAVASVL